MEKKELIQVIYFDTNALRQISHGSGMVEYLELRDLAEKLSIRIFIPETVFQEWENHHQLDVHRTFNQIKSNITMLNKLLNYEYKDVDEPEDIEGIIHKILLEKLSAIGIEIINTPPDININILIDMAVKKIPPFEENDKGFRDTIILFTLIYHMHKNNYLYAMFISGDKIYTNDNVLNILRKNKLNIAILKNINESKEYIKLFIQMIINKSIEEEMKKIKLYLEAQFEIISKFILKNAQVSLLFLRGFLSEEKLLNDEIKKINAIRPKSILKVYSGFLLSNGDKDEDAEIKKISFSVDVEFDVMIQTFEFKPFDYPKFSLAEPEKFPKIARYLPDMIEQQKIINRSISVEAMLKKMGNDFTDLELIKVITF